MVEFKTAKVSYSLHFLRTHMEFRDGVSRPTSKREPIKWCCQTLLRRLITLANSLSMLLCHSSRKTFFATKTVSKIVYNIHSHLYTPSLNLRLFHQARTLFAIRQTHRVLPARCCVQVHAMDRTVLRRTLCLNHSNGKRIQINIWIYFLV